ncbi:MAG: diacylglycerol kinase [Deltaproteobacteria bacterium]|jgi:diacylglycerol kinase (ATP)|nr:diacylglycerol kinase [Deltaproteobacteria bacterium]
MLKTIKNIPRRAVSAMGYSLAGLAMAFRKEESIRLETIALILLVAILAPIPWPIWKKIALISIYLLIPLTELLNSALEDICDLVSPQYNDKIKAAKDKGSAAVLMAIIVAIIALAALIVCP